MIFPEVRRSVGGRGKFCYTGGSKEGLAWTTSSPGQRRKISATEMERRRKALRQADASNRLEDQYRSPAGTSVFEAFIHGEIEMDGVLPRLKSPPSPSLKGAWLRYTLDDGITLKNRLGAIDHDALEAIEADYASNRLLQLNSVTVPPANSTPRT
jgi:hypothetical protein